MNNVEKIMNSEVFAVCLALFVGLYAAFVGSKSKLPIFIRNLFNNPIFRFVFLSLILIHNFSYAPHVAIAVVLLFTLTMYSIRQEELKENFYFLDSWKLKNKEK